MCCSFTVNVVYKSTGVGIAQSMFIFCCPSQREGAIFFYESVVTLGSLGSEANTNNIPQIGLRTIEPKKYPQNPNLRFMPINPTNRQRSK
jgi:hypothetical protein